MTPDLFNYSDVLACFLMRRQLFAQENCAQASVPVVWA
jgi:hypothetical protein